MEDITAAAVKQSAGLYKKLFAPVLTMVDGANSLEELKQGFENEKFIEKLAKSMDISDLDALMQRSMIYADLEGRVQDG